MNRMENEQKILIVNQYQEKLSSTPEQGQKEQSIQDFLERNTELFSEALTYKNYFHQDILISKCPVMDLKSDYAYLSKKSDEWKIVFGELELPDYNFFRKGSGDFTSEFNHAINQIRQWKLRIKNNQNEVFNFFKLLLQPESMRENPIVFEFELIFGRSEDKNKTAERLRLIQSVSQSEGIVIKSFDTISNDFMGRRENTRKNVISYNGKSIRYKHLNTRPTWDFALYNSEQLIVSPEQRKVLVSWGYDMNSWDLGKKLGQNGKVSPENPFEGMLRKRNISSTKSN
ncbi:Shedu anti-phage system protein SduA domain-containing protein [Pseudomonas abyssi]|uniref:Shedu anti-phage system protein SduA domain-containing protein n=1 Tax=Pseudomonas abyssi TaxID=170540 RepID=UPI000E46AEE9|nr:Shedu anti-phage system protein SduA domain-containing protein [Halopseudomonas gallaeciensis]